MKLGYALTAEQACLVAQGLLEQAGALEHGGQPQTKQ